MIKKNSISIFLPIRKNSKRLKNKNILALKNYKLGISELKISQLLKLKRLLKKENIVSEIIVSTDVEKILLFLRNKKDIIIHKRSKKLSSDNSLQSLIKLAPKLCNNNHILWTHVTSPLFDENEYINFIKEFFRKKYNSAFSSSIVNKFLMNHKKKWISHDSKKIKWPKTQDLRTIYEVNSAAFIAKKKIYELYKDRLDNNPHPIISSKISSLDIDDKEDFDLFRKICKI